MGPAGALANRLHPSHRADLDEQGFAGTSTDNADVYVFAVQTARTHEEYVPLEVGQWSFFVLGRSVVEDRGQRGIGLAAFERLTSAVPYEQLGARIRSAAKGPGPAREP